MKKYKVTLLNCNKKLSSEKALLNEKKSGDKVWLKPDEGEKKSYLSIPSSVDIRTNTSPC
jgi:hypothetical protein